MIKQLNIFIILLLGVSFTSYAQETDQIYSIVGTWKAEEDENSRWIFQNNGVLITDYLGVSDVLDKYDYNMSSDPPACGKGPVLVKSSRFNYLKLIDHEDNEVSCYYIMGLTDEYLTLKHTVNGYLAIFKKAN